MKISCQNCSSKYTVSDEKVQGKTVKLKCKKCGATILVNAGGATTVAGGAGGAGVTDHVSSSTDAASVEGMSYLVNVAEGDQRTMTVPEIVAAYQSQIVTADTYVWADGMGDWQPLGQVETIVAALSGGAPAAAAPSPSAPPPAMAPAASSAEQVASAASLAAASRPAAARREPGKRADVFGSEKNDDIATSAPLFSASARAAASNAAAAARPSQQREENSVLFSLSALTQKAATSAPAPAPSRKDSREDSGLIDLRALAASANPQPSASSASAVAAIAPDDAGLFPLGMPASAPAAPPVATPVVQPPPASKAPMFIGIGALVAALAIVGVFFAMKGGSDEKPVTDTGTATTATAPAAQPTPTQTAEPAPTAEAAATATATATASATASAAVASAPKSGPVKGTPVKTSGTPTKTSGTPTTKSTATTPPKKSGNCGCPAGDLMCAMKCSAGGK